MQQVVNNYAVEAYNDVYKAYRERNTTDFDKACTRFLNSFDVMEEVLVCRREWLAGEWIGKAEDWGEVLDNDFAYDSLVGNAKTLITTWADQIAMRCIPDYAQRTYQGMLGEVYKSRWVVWLEKLQANLEEGTTIERLTADDYYHIYRQWAMGDSEYTREAKEGLGDLWAAAERVFAECTKSGMLLSSKIRIPR